MVEAEHELATCLPAQGPTHHCSLRLRASLEGVELHAGNSAASSHLVPPEGSLSPWGVLS